ncbi:MAG: hypothetical protein LLG97_09200 [Deltaproteobacteria bacterium]|nr:hypothetical protein [Deltaproteobacteria bacterium]
MIEIQDDHGEITAITLNGERLDSDDGEVWFLPKGLVAGLKVSELPETVAFEPCKFREDSTVVLDSIPMRLKRIASDKIRVEFEDGGTRKYWDGDIGFKPWMESKRATVEERQTEVGDVQFESYDDDGAYIWLQYSAEFQADSVEAAIQLAEQIADEIDGAAELRLGGRLIKASDPANEAEFTVRVVLPILRKLGFANIKYNHGRREYGKDIVFARLTEFQELEHWAAQVKYGDIDGGAGSEIDKIITQADDAFKMPFYDIYTRQQQRISKLVVIASGKFTENATEKICDKIESHALRNNLVFLDGDKIETLAERFRGST